MLRQMQNLLRHLIGESEVEKMTTLQAQKIVADFYMRIQISLLGSRIPGETIDYFCLKALESFGLENFA